jgi:hypothetical protein
MFDFQAQSEVERVPLLRSQVVQVSRHGFRPRSKQRATVMLKLLNFRVAVFYRLEFSVCHPASLFQLREDLVQLVLGHVPLGGESEVAATLLFYLGESFEPCFGLLLGIAE